MWGNRVPIGNLHNTFNTDHKKMSNGCRRANGGGRSPMPWARRATMVAMGHPVVLWSTPRRVSTAFDKLMRGRGDHRVFAEPFSVPFSFGPDRSWERFPSTSGSATRLSTEPSAWSVT